MTLALFSRKVSNIVQNTKTFLSFVNFKNFGVCSSPPPAVFSVLLRPCFSIYHIYTSYAFIFSLLLSCLLSPITNKSMDWFLYDNSLRHERVKENPMVADEYRLSYFFQKIIDMKGKVDEYSLTGFIVPLFQDMLLNINSKTFLNEISPTYSHSIALKQICKICLSLTQAKPGVTSLTSLWCVSLLI